MAISRGGPLSDCIIDGRCCSCRLLCKEDGGRFKTANYTQGQTRGEVKIGQPEKWINIGERKKEREREREK